MPFQFQHKEFAWLFAALAMLVALFWFILRWKKKVMRRIGDEKLVRLLINHYSPRLFNTRFIFFSAAFALGVVAVMNPRSPGAPSGVVRKGIDVAIALDVSKSMLATDLAPSRLERARQFANKLMAEMPDDRIALVLFAGKAYMQMPLTTDHGAARMYVNAATPDAIPQQGTRISEAIEMSARVFNDEEKRFKTIILISDGEEHDESAAKTAAEMAEKGVMINTVGVGSPDGSQIIDPATGFPKKDEAGNTVISKLNEKTLKEVADATNGLYIHLQGSDEAVRLMKAQLSQIDRKAFGDISQMNFRTWYAWVAAAMFLLLLLEILVPEAKKKS